MNKLVPNDRWNVTFDTEKPKARPESGLTHTKNEGQKVFLKKFWRSFWDLFQNEFCSFWAFWDNSRNDHTKYFWTLHFWTRLPKIPRFWLLIFLCSGISSFLVISFVSGSFEMSHRDPRCSCSRCWHVWSQSHTRDQGPGTEEGGGGLIHSSRCRCDMTPRSALLCVCKPRLYLSTFALGRRRFKYWAWRVSRTKSIDDASQLFWRGTSRLLVGRISY